MHRQGQQGHAFQARRHNHAAQREAVAVFSDLARSFYDDIETNPQWQIEVTDEFSTPTFPVP
jgi:hypothetical protein